MTFIASPQVYAQSDQQNCNIFGSPGYTQFYSWSVPDTSNGSVCMQGKGYTSSTAITWNGIGCGTFGSGSVPWGNVVSFPSVRGISQTGITGTPVTWG